jgi:hypothetical protein
MVALDHRRRHRRQQRARHQHRLRARVFQHVGVVVGGQQRVHRHRHDAGVHRAQEGHRPVQAVVHQQQHAFLALEAQRTQPGRQAAHAVFELAVAQAAAVVDEGGLARGALRVAGQQVLREVEAVAGGRHGGGRHGLSPGAALGP